MKVTINFRKTVEENAQEYFEKAKKARKKLEGAKKALNISLKKLEDEKQKKETALEKLKLDHEERQAKIKRKPEWFEKFRWFYSSEGFLVIGGRDATTNDIVVKKHVDKEDLIFHTDMAGSPFFIIKAEGKEIGEQTIQETANATLCFSKAWKMGLSTTPSFWVKPDQVTKEAAAGEYISKGAFMIRGKTNYVQPLVDCAVGLYKDKIMCAPLSAIKKHCEKPIVLVQGKKKPSEIAKIIKKLLGGELDEIIKVIPSGGVDIKKN